MYTTPGYQLICLDAKTGQRVTSFGNNGAVDLKADDDQKIQPDLTTGEIGWQSAHCGGRQGPDRLGFP